MSEECAICGGTGWKIVEKDGISGAERCQCAINARSTHVINAARIPPLYEKASLENFSLPRDNKAAHDALGTTLTTVKRYVRDYPHADRPGLLLIGNPGTGKTHLAVAALRGLILRGYEGIFYDYQNLLDNIRSSYDANSGATDKEAYRTVLDTDILLLDDLGAHRVTDWVEDTVTAILTYRCNNRKPLIATTNLVDPEAGATMNDRSGATVQVRTTLSERIGMRARSRLFEMCRVVRMPSVDDYRIKRSRAS